MVHLVLALAFSLGVGEATAQNALRECTGSRALVAAGKKGQCVEFTVRYFAGGKVEIADANTKESEKCTLGKDCKHYGTSLIDVKNVTLMQSNTHLCYRSCDPYGNCVNKCPKH
jgi:hypothetical protein